jgi:hypothetical protein
MPKLFACIMAENPEESALIAVATEFAYRLELIENGILFDVSGLERLIGKPQKIMTAIAKMMETHGVTGNVVVHPVLDTAILLAQSRKGIAVTAERLRELDQQQLELGQLPLFDLPLEPDTLTILQTLGIRQIGELRKIPADELISRYGKNFIKVLDIINEQSRRPLIPNIKERQISWEPELDDPISDFEQLMFLLDHGLSELLVSVHRNGKSTELIEICLLPENKSVKLYEVKSSRPTLDKSFWMKLIYLKISSDPPPSAILGLKTILKFTPPRPTQKGLYAVTRPEPENLLLTVNKIKKLLGEKNVGVPVLLNSRLPEAFELNAEKMPEGLEKSEIEIEKPLVGFYYYVPPLKAQVLIRRKQLIYLKTSRFAGRVAEYSGVWKRSSRWWGNPWRIYEWDVELENLGVYRLIRRAKDYFVIGEYD